MSIPHFDNKISVDNLAAVSCTTLSIDLVLSCKISRLCARTARLSGFKSWQLAQYLKEICVLLKCQGLTDQEYLCDTSRPSMLGSLWTSPGRQPLQFPTFSIRRTRIVCTSRLNSKRVFTSHSCPSAFMFRQLAEILAGILYIVWMPEDINQEMFV